MALCEDADRAGVEGILEAGGPGGQLIYIWTQARDVSGHIRISRKDSAFSGLFPLFFRSISGKSAENNPEKNRKKHNILIFALG